MLIMGLGQEAWRCGYHAWAPCQGSGRACVGQRPVCRHTCVYTQCSHMACVPQGASCSLVVGVQVRSPDPLKVHMEPSENDVRARQLPGRGRPGQSRVLPSALCLSAPLTLFRAMGLFLEAGRTTDGEAEKGTSSQESSETRRVPGSGLWI